MYYLLLLHSALRWLLLLSLVWAVFISWEGHFFKRPFRPSDQLAVNTASVLSQIQLLLGFGLYIKSPVAQGFWSDRSLRWSDSLFFGLIHIGFMTLAIILITVGASLSRRETDERRKFKTVLQYYGIALMIILAAIPWPFSPLAQRPWIRDF